MFQRLRDRLREDGIPAAFQPNPMPQPTSASYPPFPTLLLFEDFNVKDPSANATTAPTKNAAMAREAIGAAGGDVDDWDSTFTVDGVLVAKYWADYSHMDDDDDDVAIYSTFNPGQGTFHELKLTMKQARTFNVPGRAIRPVYAIAPTAAQTAAGAPYNPEYLSSEEDALKLAEEWYPDQATAVQLRAKIQDTTESEHLVLNGETRRVFKVQWAAQWLNAGKAILDQNGPREGDFTGGLDPDGSWSTAGSWDYLETGPEWKAKPLADDGINTNPPQAVMANPVRELNTYGAVNEVMDTTGAKMIRRTDV